MPSESFRIPAGRIAACYAAIGLLLATLTTGLAYRQLVHNRLYAEREKIQNQRRILLPAPRGRILDRQGRVLVDNEPVFSAVLDLGELRPEFRREYASRARTLRAARSPLPENLGALSRAAVVQRYLDRLNSITGRADAVDSLRLERHFNQRLLLPFPVAGDLPPADVARFLEQIPPASPLQLLTSTRRRYPHHATAAHTLGFVNERDVPESEVEFGENLMTFGARGTIGMSGLERQFDDALQGTLGGQIWIVDPTGRQLDLVESRAPAAGRDLRTSLDLDVQLAAEAALEGQTGAIVAIEVTTGEVLALASRPSFDLAAFQADRTATVQQMDAEGAWLNRAVQGLYPPGSTFKLLTALAGLRAGVITADSHETCPGHYGVGGRLFPCNRRSGHGDVDLVSAIRASCNVFFYKFGLDVTADRLAAEARRFGLDHATGIELPAEVDSMLVPDRDWKRRMRGEAWFPGDTANYSIGQGFLRVTPLQMACFTASLARGETTTRPTLLHSPRNLAASPTPIGIPPALLGLISQGMEQAVQLGTARLAQIPGIRIAGKTGTAQVQVATGTLELAWFIGYAPVESPRVAVCVVLEGGDVDLAFAGGLKAAPAARTLFDAALPDLPPAPVPAPEL